jgi:hypothetical protein
MLLDFLVGRNLRFFHYFAVGDAGVGVRPD